MTVALGTAWAAAGHSIAVTGRSREPANRAAAEIGAAAASADPRDLADSADVVVVAVAWSGLQSALMLADAPAGSLSGKTVIDCTNPVDYATGRMLPAAGSAADLVARLSPGAHVVKALHLFAGASWPFTGETAVSPVVAICGDDANALGHTAELITDLGGRTAVLGGLDSARQAEEVAGFVMRVVAAGANPRFAVPDVDPAAFQSKAAEQ